MAGRLQRRCATTAASRHLRQRARDGRFGQLGRVGPIRDLRVLAGSRTARPSSTASTTVPRDTQLGNWLASNFPNLFGCSNPYISSYPEPVSCLVLGRADQRADRHGLTKLWTPSGTSQNTYAQAFASPWASTPTPARSAGTRRAQGYGFKVTAAGSSGATCNVGSNSAPFGVSNNANRVGVPDPSEPEQQFQPVERELLRRQPGRRPLPPTTSSTASTRPAISPTASTLSRPHRGGRLTRRPRSGTPTASTASRRTAPARRSPSSTPTMTRASSRPWTLFDSQFGLTDSGRRSTTQYGPAASFLTVLNQSGQTTLAALRPTPAAPAPTTGKSRRSWTSNGPTPSPPAPRSSWSRPTASRSPT